jgi:hypothetical protein
MDVNYDPAQFVYLIANTGHSLLAYQCMLVGKPNLGHTLLEHWRSFWVSSTSLLIRIVYIFI